MKLPLHKLGLKSLALFVVASGLMSIGFSVVVPSGYAAAACPTYTTFPNPGSSGYSDGQIECMLRSGVDSAISWDDCRSVMPGAATFFRGTLREIINGYGAEGTYSQGGCGYRSDTWISGRGKPNTVIPIAVPYNTTAIPIQVNYVKFMNAPLVQTDYNQDSSTSTWRRIYNDNSRWANNTNSANDRRPNSIGTTGQDPAHVGSRTKIVGYRVYRNSGATQAYPGASVVGGVGSSMEGNRTNYSRYWFAKTPIYPTLRFSSGVTSDTTVWIQLTYRRADWVYKGSGGTFNYETLCTTGSNRHPVYTASGNAYSSVIDKCTTSTSMLRVDIDVPKPYTLTPTLTIAPEPKVPQNKRVTPNPRVTSTGSAGVHRWTLVRAIFDPGNPVVYNPVTSGSACSVALATASNCVAHDYSLTDSFNTGTTNLPRLPYDVPIDMAVGTNICFVLAVQQPNQSATASDWAYSPLRCTKVVTAPDISTVQIWGYDSVIGGEATAQARLYDSSPDKYQGSWAEYGIMSGAPNTNVASAAGLNGGDATGSQSGWSRLTFANIAIDTGICDGSFGCYSPTIPTADSLVATLKSRCSSYPNTPVDTPVINNFNGVQYICSHDTIHIKDDITINNTSVRNINNLPQVVIIGKNIVIDKDVKRVDAWLIASPEGTDGGNISTCTEATGSSDYFMNFNDISLAADTCREQLVINGPVISNKLFLYRTNPTNANGDSAERFNLRADAFLWAYAGGGATDPIARTVSIRELPPRF